MRPRDFILLFVTKTVLCQINGEFWWMHEKVAQLQNIEPPPPKFEDLGEFETDESVKVVFKDDERLSNYKPIYKENNRDLIIRNKISPVVVFRDHNELKPEYLQRDIPRMENRKNITINNNTFNSANIILNQDTSSSKPEVNSKGDEFKFIFPENSEALWKNVIKNFTNTADFNLNNKTEKLNKVILNDKILFEEDKRQTQVESICTFITANNCIRKNGIIHMPGLYPKNYLLDTQKICCILPLTLNTSSNNQKFNQNFNKRNKRSNPSEQLNSPLQQRTNLLLRKHGYQIQQPKIATTTARTKSVQKIVTPGDYGDPYWNIKNSKFRKPSFQSTTIQDYQNTKYDDYADDYDVELPKPGLIGIYSDHREKQSNWKLEASKGFTYGGTGEDSEEDDGVVGFGYSTIDPRLGDRKSKPMQRKPQRLTTLSTDKDNVQISESQTIHFHSTPDFHVLEGFKLLNLVGDNNKNIRKRTTENYYSDEDISIEHTSPVTVNLDIDYDDGINVNEQIFKSCGRTRIKSKKDADFGNSAVETNCDPWIAIVVLTKNPQSILCYATIIHPRAAVTAANCIHGKTAGKVSTVAGIWDLKDRSNSQHRMASVFTHPQFRSDDLANDYGLLHWKRPLRLQTNVQPACLAEPHTEDDCYFAGWGGFDQVLQQRPQSQHAIILTLRSCNEKISAPDVQIPTGAFCASVDTIGTVTGVGGPLLCKSGDRVSMVGVAVYREDVVVLLPAYDWVTSAVRELNIN